LVLLWAVGAAALAAQSYLGVPPERRALVLYYMRPEIEAELGMRMRLDLPLARLDPQVAVVLWDRGARAWRWYVLPSEQARDALRQSVFPQDLLPAAMRGAGVAFGEAAVLYLLVLGLARGMARRHDATRSAR
jgi:hypothetical protein